MHPDSHLIFDIITAGVTVGWFVVGLLIKNSLNEIKLDQADTKAELIGKQNDLQIDFNTKHAQNTQTIAVHSAEDLQKFGEISRTLTRMDHKLDKLNGISH